MSIVDSEYLIKNIHLVMYSFHKRKKINNNLKGRYSDCFAYVLSGKTKYTFTDGLSFTATSDDLLYIAKGSKYVMDILSESYEVIFIDFEFDSPAENKSRIFRLKTPSELKNIFNSIKRKWAGKKVAYSSDCLSSLYKIYALALQNEAASYVSSAKQNALNEAVQKIADDFSNPDLSVGELATLSGTSEGHFRRLFKNVYHISPVQYIKDIRINHAKTLLMLDNHTVEEVAILSGFSNVYYFCKCFKTETEMTPSQYKASHKI